MIQPVWTRFDHKMAESSVLLPEFIKSTDRLVMISVLPVVVFISERTLLTFECLVVYCWR